MQQIGNIIYQQQKRLPALQPNSKSRQAVAVEAFLADFPTIDSVRAFFTPTNWPTAIKYTTQMMARPCISLAQVDEVYDADGAALQIVQGQFVGIFNISSSRDQYPTKSANFAAKLFLAKYGGFCSMFDMMIFFANYPLEYKETYSQFDAQDILKQFGKKYIPFKRSRSQNQQEEQQQDADTYNAVKPGELVFLWLAEGRTEEDIRSGDLYRNKIITEKMIKEARKQLTTYEPF